MLGLLLISAGAAFLISSAICSLWLLLLLGAGCVAAGVLLLRKR